MSVIDDLVKNLPPAPGEALLAFADRVYENILAGGLQVPANDVIAITTFMRRFSKKYSISANLTKLHREEFPDDIHFMSAHVQSIRSMRASIVGKSIDGHVEELITEYDTRTDAESFGLARLNAEEKQKIHTHIGHIRKILEESDLPDRKKNKLFERLNELAEEVDAHGTMTDRFFAFAGDVGFVLGDMTTKAKPLVQEVKEILRIVSRSRARQEGVSLPPGDEVLRLPSPDSSDKD
jgi:hypothetical protein